ncbi:hypothetical protein J3E68DRAFT_396240 [Trichoderma sp. SZMC 28012]
MCQAGVGREGKIRLCILLASFSLLSSDKTLTQHRVMLNRLYRRGTGHETWLPGYGIHRMRGAFALFLSAPPGTSFSHPLIFLMLIILPPTDGKRQTLFSPLPG